jgi:hypothetical protein
MFSLRALNRATFARQLLLERSPMCALGKGQTTSMRAQPYVGVRDVAENIAREGNRLLQYAFGAVTAEVEITA